MFLTILLVNLSKLESFKALKLDRNFVMFVCPEKTEVLLDALSRCAKATEWEDYITKTNAE